MSSPTGPTPPPPQQYSSPEPAFVAPVGPGLSEPQRLINTFIAPSKTFEDLKRNASWWVPWLISAVFALLFGVVAVQKIDMVHFVQQQIEKSPSAQRRLEQATPAQREQGIALQATITKVTFYVIPVFTLIGGLIIAAVLMGIFNFILGAEVPFARALAVTFYAFLPGIIKSILLCVSLFASSDPSTIDIAGNPMPTNPAFFMDPLGNKFVYTFLSYVDIFAIWYVVLLGIGFAVASSNRKVSVSSGISAVFVAYGLWALGAACFKMIF
jgi:hypothetical protein